MSQLDQPAIAATSILTPASGTVSAFMDSVNKKRKWKDDAGRVTSYIGNYSTTSQSPSAATRTYIAGSNIQLGTQGLQVGSRFRWRFNMTKTAAGIASSVIDVAFGTAGTTSDTAQVSFTKPAGTAASDEGFVEIDVIVRTINASTGVAVGEFTMTHNGNTTGHMTIPNAAVNTVSSNFNTVSPTNVGLCITTGASDAITIQQIQTEAWDV
jgi:hypothetical protein